MDGSDQSKGVRQLKSEQSEVRTTRNPSTTKSFLTDLQDGEDSDTLQIVSKLLTKNGGKRCWCVGEGFPEACFRVEASSSTARGMFSC